MILPWPKPANFVHVWIALSVYSSYGLVKEIVDDSYTIFLYYKSENINNKRLLSKYQLISFLCLQVMHVYVLALLHRLFCFKSKFPQWDFLRKLLLLHTWNFLLNSFEKMCFFRRKLKNDTKIKFQNFWEHPIYNIWDYAFKQTCNKADQSFILTSTAYDWAVARIIAPRTNTNALPIMASLRPIQSTIKPVVEKNQKLQHDKRYKIINFRLELSVFQVMKNYRCVTPHSSDKYYVVK